MGNYGEILFAASWYNSLDESVKEHFIADASRATTLISWHIYSRMNWGEPWYAGFERQTEYRMKNQAYFRRNLMPGMLGWFRMTPSTSVEDISGCWPGPAAFNAGYRFVVDYASLEKNGLSDYILQPAGRMGRGKDFRIFPEDQRKRMEDLDNEFHLERG
ncbi:MAG: hypothetical protein R2744_13495 [Bacteroidales bacterium]